MRCRGIWNKFLGIDTKRTAKQEKFHGGFGDPALPNIVSPDFLAPQDVWSCVRPFSGGAKRLDRAAAAIRHTGFAELAAEGDKIDVERKAQMRRDFPL